MSELLFDEATHTYTLGGVALPSVTDVCAPLTSDKYGGKNAVVQYAANRGSRIHELCALYDFDALPDEIEAECVPYLKAWADFCRDWRPVWERVEWPGWSSLGFAGTVDRIGLIDGKRRVVDIKTASSLDRASKISLCCQTFGYTVIAVEEGMRMDGEPLGVQLKKDGTYTVHDTGKIQDKYNFKASELFAALLQINKALKGEPCQNK